MTIYLDLYRYRELFANLFRRDLKAKYKGSVLGVAWSIANPLALMRAQLDTEPRQPRGMPDSHWHIVRSCLAKRPKDRPTAAQLATRLDRLDGGLPQWDPGATSLSRVDATHWTITLTGKESTQLEYKYTLGDWDHVEKDGACGEIPNRQLTLSYGSDGTQNIGDTVPNWRDVAPCGS